MKSPPLLFGLFDVKNDKSYTIILCIFLKGVFLRNPLTTNEQINNTLFISLYRWKHPIWPLWDSFPSCGFQSEKKTFVEDHPMIIPTKFGSNWLKLFQRRLKCKSLWMPTPMPMDAKWWQLAHHDPLGQVS